MHVDECGAPERLAGVKLLTGRDRRTASSAPTDLGRWEAKRGDEHHVQPRLVSITQATELGTVYTAGRDRGARRRRPRARHVPARRRRPARQRRRGARRLVRRADHRGRRRRRLLRRHEERARLRRGGRLLQPRARRATSPSPASSSASSPRRCASSPPSSRRCSRGDLWLRSARHANAMAARLGRGGGGRSTGSRSSTRSRPTRVFARLPRAAIERLLAELPARAPVLHLGRRARRGPLDVRLGHRRGRRRRVRRRGCARRSPPPRTGRGCGSAACPGRACGR